VRFARHLAAALAAVAAVVALGLGLEHSSAVARLIGVPPGATGPSQREIQLSNPPPGTVFVRGPGGKGRPASVARRSDGAPPDLGATSEVVRTTLLEALIIAVAAGLAAEGRRYRRQRRRAALAADDTAAEGTAAAPGRPAGATRERDRSK
jgi:hypothetical protein